MLATRFWAFRGTPVGIAFFAGACLLAASVLLDLSGSANFLAEDGLKLFGVVTWTLCGFWAHGESSSLMIHG